MTLEKLEKANELRDYVSFAEEQLKRIKESEKEKTLRIVGLNIQFNIPDTMNDTIITLCKTEYQNKLDKLNKQFEDL